MAAPGVIVLWYVPDGIEGDVDARQLIRVSDAEGVLVDAIDSDLW